MNYNFTDRVRMALAKGREAALELRHDYLGTEHMLLGLLKTKDPQVEGILASVRIAPSALRSEVLDAVRPGKGEVNVKELPYTSRGKKVLELAMRASRDRHTGEVGGRELLAGLLAEEKGIAASVLRQLGLEEKHIWEDGPFASDRPLADLALDDTSDRSIYEQIVEQIQERVATGALEAGQRLPTVRHLADQLDIAPGTVARAYSELERLGLVVTQGSRGTRVAPRERAAVPGGERAETLTGLLRPVAVAAFHLGATADELRRALEEAMADIFRGNGS